MGCATSPNYKIKLILLEGKKKKKKKKKKKTSALEKFVDVGASPAISVTTLLLSLIWVRITQSREPVAILYFLSLSRPWSSLLATASHCAHTMSFGNSLKNAPWKKVDLPESFLLGNEEAGFFGLEVLDGSYANIVSEIANGQDGKKKKNKKKKKAIPPAVPAAQTSQEKAPSAIQSTALEEKAASKAGRKRKRAVNVEGKMEGKARGIAEDDNSPALSSAPIIKSWNRKRRRKDFVTSLADNAEKKGKIGEEGQDFDMEDVLKEEETVVEFNPGKTEWDEFGLDKSLLRGLLENGFTSPTPIQAAVMKVLKQFSIQVIMSRTLCLPSFLHSFIFPTDSLSNLKTSFSCNLVPTSRGDYAFLA